MARPLAQPMANCSSSRTVQQRQAANFYTPTVEFDRLMAEGLSVDVEAYWGAGFQPDATGRTSRTGRVTLQTGQIRSKDTAAAWVLEQLPLEHQPVLARARVMYLQGEDEERWDDITAVRAHVEYVLAAIRQSAPSGSL
jgi:hypothetical protein